MKKTATKGVRHKGIARRGKSDKPVELDRGWHELEAQHDRIKSDWSSLAAQLGGLGDDKAAFD